MKVWVVMSNDYPDSVFATERLAETYIQRQQQRRDDYSPRIYWRAYEFNVTARDTEA